MHMYREATKDNKHMRQPVSSPRLLFQHEAALLRHNMGILSAELNWVKISNVIGPLSFLNL